MHSLMFGSLSLLIPETLHSELIAIEGDRGRLSPCVTGLNRYYCTKLHKQIRPAINHN